MFGLSLSCIYNQRQATSKNSEQSNATQANKDSESNNNYPMDNLVAQTVQNGATASSHETENVSETSLVKQRMKKFDIKFKTRMRQEHERFKQKRLELEMQTKELETKHQLLEEERELERKVKRTALENDDLRFQSTSARDKSRLTGPKRIETPQTGTVGSTTI